MSGPTPASITQATDLRKAVDASTKKLISESLAQIPEGKTGALVVIADQNGARGHMAWRVNDTWKVANEVGVDWKGKVTGTVAVMGSW